MQSSRLAFSSLQTQHGLYVRQLGLRFRDLAGVVTDLDFGTCFASRFKVRGEVRRWLWSYGGHVSSRHWDL
jgi:hypothetical protein